MDRSIKCDCGKTIFAEIETTNVFILKSIAVAQFSKGKVNIKCRNCKRWIESVPQNIFFTKEE